MVTIFTTPQCGKCVILKNKLNENGIKYTDGDLQEIINLGYRNVPVLKKEDAYMNFGQAIDWINKIKRGE